MNPVELRYEIYKHLVDIADVAALDSPKPGKPLTISLYAPDPYVRIREGKARHYRVTIEETD